MATTPVFLPGESHGQRSLAGYSPWGRKGRTRLSDLTTNYVYPLAVATMMLSKKPLRNSVA